MEVVRVAFRVDSSYEIGTGHVKRCLSLASELARYQVQCIFFIKDLQGSLTEEIASSGHQVVILDYGNKFTSKQDFDQTLDAELIIEHLKIMRPNLLIVDHYRIDIIWERKIKPYVEDVVVIDDYLNRPHDCSYFFNQNYFLGETLETSCINFKKGLFVGTRFALLGIEYLEKRMEMLKLKKSSTTSNSLKCLVYFGGSDSENLILRMLNIVKKGLFPQIQFNMILGVNNRNSADVKIKSISQKNIAIHEHSKSLVSLLSESDIAIGSPGSTTWERMCLGIPSILISIADNQDSNLNYLSISGCIVSAGKIQDLTDEKIERSIKLLMNEKFLNEMKKKCLTLVDGYGAKRVAQIILPNLKKKYSLRSAQNYDIYMLYNWANEESVRENSLISDQISWERHAAWFAKKIYEKNSKLYILEVNLLPTGIVRFEYSQELSAAVISFSIDQAFRSRGYGKKILSMGMKKYDGKRYVAYVKTCNEISIKIFESLNFIQTEYDQVQNIYTYVYESFK
jgi:UDP-2,4-diacetamido-2,4,6-trideoxy-beta-L-altropyranose hydrolase